MMEDWLNTEYGQLICVYHYQLMKTNEEAPLAEPTSVAVHAVENANITTDSSAAIIGCGVVGLATLQVLRNAGATVIAIDPREQSLAIAKQVGATEVLKTPLKPIRHWHFLRSRTVTVPTS
ncbi:MAG: hypothetical protein Ct9H300mP19_00750 [Dehalococcoidia bacterium]|nr:MAG: hypothetical protein Ct9H300mP19_00750 [Dehalococcoidia bacterium]